MEEEGSKAKFSLGPSGREKVELRSFVWGGRETGSWVLIFAW